MDAQRQPIEVADQKNCQKHDRRYCKCTYCTIDALYVDVIGKSLYDETSAILYLFLKLIEMKKGHDHSCPDERFCL